ncbi:hypothetical protein YC2023_096300 [Brassica napus]
MEARSCLNGGGSLFYRFVHGGPVIGWLSSFCNSTSAISCKFYGLSSKSLSLFGYGGCSLFVVVSHPIVSSLLCLLLWGREFLQSFFTGRFIFDEYSDAFPMKRNRDRRQVLCHWGKVLELDWMVPLCSLSFSNKVLGRGFYCLAISAAA